MKRLKVGITAQADVDAFAALWSSGIAQNIVYLGMLLQRLPEVELAAIVNCPATDKPNPLGDLFGLPTLQVNEAAGALDVIIELGVRADANLMRLFRARGGKLISYMAGNTLAMNFEDLASDVRHGEHISEVGCDACWITPQHWRMNRSYAAMTRSPNVEMAPHVWHPMCLTQSAQMSKVNAFWRPPEGAWRIGVFDPNINVLKTFHLPLLVCEEAHRAREGLIDRVLLFSASQLIGTTHFEEFCAATDLGRQKRVFAEGRFPLAQVLGTHIDAVVTHQWENELNYLYWDALYLGWPLIHNSEAFEEVGYYYPAFDPQKGGAILKDALEGHAAWRDAQREGVFDLLWRFNIDNPQVQRRHAELLESAMAA